MRYSDLIRWMQVGAGGVLQGYALHARCLQPWVL